MLFVFRGTRFLQIVLALFTLVMGVSCVLYLNLYSDDGAIFAALIAIVFGGLAVMGFALALRMPTSFVAIADDKTRIRFGGFADSVILNSDVVGARLVKHPVWGGLGVRTNFGGTVALVSAWGEVAELDLKSPMKVWIIPKLWPIKAKKLRLSVRNPQKLVDRYTTGKVTQGDAMMVKKPKPKRR